MIKGTSIVRPLSSLLTSRSVMSGIITGPHFRKYFGDPGPGELGIMVAVLEIGAFSTFFYFSVAQKLTGM